MVTSKRIYGPYNCEASSLCFGTMQFGAGATEADSAKMYEDCRAAGVNSLTQLMFTPRVSLRRYWAA